MTADRISNIEKFLKPGTRLDRNQMSSSYFHLDSTRNAVRKTPQSRKYNVVLINTLYTYTHVLVNKKAFFFVYFGEQYATSLQSPKPRYRSLLAHSCAILEKHLHKVRLGVRVCVTLQISYITEYHIGSSCDSFLINGKLFIGERYTIRDIVNGMVASNPYQHPLQCKYLDNFEEPSTLGRYRGAEKNT